MARPPVRRSGPPPGRTYRPPPPPADDAGPRKPRLYDRRAWRDGARPLKLRRNPLCERCLLAGDHKPAEHVHHRIDVAEDESLAYDLANLESLCHECHSRETRRRQKVMRHVEAAQD